MKSSVNDNVKKSKPKFEPIKISFVIETAEEARMVAALLGNAGDVAYALVGLIITEEEVAPMTDVINSMITSDDYDEFLFQYVD